MVGIITYGAYIPRYRIKVEEITRVWGANAADVTGGLGVFEKSVPDLDEDAATIAVEAARNALKRRNIDPEQIGAVYVGSESHPYAVKPTACTVGEAIGATPHMTAADFEFACKAGTAAIQTCMGLVKSKMIPYGLAIGADVSQGAPGDALEYTAAAGGAAYIIGNDDPIATIHHTCSFTSNTPDFWRREGQDYPRHGGRFTGDPGYFKHVKGASLLLLEQTKKTPKDFTYAVFHQPNAKFPQKVAKTSALLQNRSSRALSSRNWATLTRVHRRSALRQRLTSQNRVTLYLSARLVPVPAATRSISKSPTQLPPAISTAMRHPRCSNFSKIPFTSTMHSMQNTRERS